MTVFMASVIDVMFYTTYCGINILMFCCLHAICNSLNFQRQVPQNLILHHKNAKYINKIAAIDVGLCKITSF